MGFLSGDDPFFPQNDPFIGTQRALVRQKGEPGGSVVDPRKDPPFLPGSKTSQVTRFTNPPPFPRPDPSQYPSEDDPFPWRNEPVGYDQETTLTDYFLTAGSGAVINPALLLNPVIVASHTLTPNAGAVPADLVVPLVDIFAHDFITLSSPPVGLLNWPGGTWTLTMEIAGGTPFFGIILSASLQRLTPAGIFLGAGLAVFPPLAIGAAGAFTQFVTFTQVVTDGLVNVAGRSAMDRVVLVVNFISIGAFGTFTFRDNLPVHFLDTPFV